MTPAYPIEIPLQGEWGRTKIVKLLRDGIEFPTVRGPTFFKFKKTGASWNSVCKKMPSCVPQFCARQLSLSGVLLTAGATAGVIFAFAKLRQKA